MFVLINNLNPTRDGYKLDSSKKFYTKEVSKDVYVSINADTREVLIKSLKNDVNSIPIPQDIYTWIKMGLIYEK